MKICAVTMVYRDYWALSQWYAHYSRAVGSENLFVVAHGHDPKVSIICPKASIITVPRGNLDDFDRKRSRMLNGIQRGLNEVYDWVIRTDVDELICFDPALHSSIASLLSNRPADAVFALGLDIVEQIEDVELEGLDQVFEKRSTAVFNGHYSKAWAVRNGIDIDLHGVQVGGLVENYPYDLPQGVYLAHLKFANTDALTRSNLHRRRIARTAGKAMPGKAWYRAKHTALKFFETVEKLDRMDWKAASAEAYSKQQPKRNENGLLRSQFTSHKFKTTLPDWFRNMD